MIDEVTALGVLPIVCMQGVRDCTQRIFVRLAELGERDFLETVEALDLSGLSGGVRYLAAEKNKKASGYAVTHES